MENSLFDYSPGVPGELISAAQKMELALGKGMSAEELRYTLELCTARVMCKFSSVYGMAPKNRLSTSRGYELTTFGVLPFTMPDVSALFRMDFLLAFTSESLMEQRLLPMFFVTLPFLKRVEACAVWARRCPGHQAVLMTWMMSLWGYDCCSARKDESRNRILKLARFDSLRTILRFVKSVGLTCKTELDVRTRLNEFVEEEERCRRRPNWLSVEELCRNEDWARAGAYDHLIPGKGSKLIVKLLDKITGKGSGPFVKMVRSGECDRMDLDVKQLFLYIVARSGRLCNSSREVLKCMKAVVERWPEVFSAHDRSGDGPLWQLLYSGDGMDLCHPQSLAEYLIDNGCDPDAKSSVGLSYNEVIECARALGGKERIARINMGHALWK